MMKGLGRKHRGTCALKPNALTSIIEHCHLVKIEMSEAMYGGDCPLCASKRSFYIKTDKQYAFCCECGASVTFR